MNKNCLLLLVIINFSVKAYTQDVKVAAVNEMIEMEKKFAALSETSSTKKAFLANFAANGLIFQKGPVNGIDYWNRQEEDSSSLIWYPSFADISKSGDIGMATGPWWYKQNRLDSNAVAFGQYVTIWKKQNNEWKIVLDIGINHHVVPFVKPVTEYKEITLQRGRQQNNLLLKKELLEAENKFTKNFNRIGNILYKIFLLNEARVYRPGNLPFTNKTASISFLNSDDKKIQYIMTGGDISAGGDWGYVYGKAVISFTREGSPFTINGSYLRVWKKQNNKWLIFADLITPDSK